MLPGGISLAKRKPRRSGAEENQSCRVYRERVRRHAGVVNARQAFRFGERRDLIFFTLNNVALSHYITTSGWLTDDRGGMSL
jgi:hypothetical protein